MELELEMEMEMEMETGMVMTQVFWDYKHLLSQPQTLSLSLSTSTTPILSASSATKPWFALSHPTPASLRYYNLDDPIPPSAISLSILNGMISLPYCFLGTGRFATKS